MLSRILAALALVAITAPLSAQDAAAPQRSPRPPAFNPAGAPAQRPPELTLEPLFQAAGPRDGLFFIRVELDRLRAEIGQSGAALIPGFPLTPTETVDLEVERFWVTSPDARFVLGGAAPPSPAAPRAASARDPGPAAPGAGQSAGDGPAAPSGAAGDTAFAFDPDSVILLRGRVRNHPHSTVYLGLSPWVSNGIIDLGPGNGRYGVSSRLGAGRHLPSGELAVFRDVAGRGRNPVPWCTAHDTDEPGAGGGDSPDGPNDPIRGLRQVQIAVETDHEFFQLFGDPAATTAYLIQMYGATSDVFIREIKVRLDITYMRIWPQPNEPFNTELVAFRSYWNANMQAVQRDCATLYSGRGDLPGGVAYLNSVCNTSAYSFCGNALGFFADAETSGVYTYDPMVAAHEFGHNFGSQHTDVYGIDNCNLVTATPRRGTIMSYCNQVVSGGLAVVDMRFHKGTQAPMRTYLAGRACVVFDCNQNGVSDAIDISTSTSLDLNANGIPDECEDCNGNLVLDSIDIALGTSLDLNANGIPDECEPDCNGNGIPDDRDITLGTSQDLHGDNKPDECDADRNSNGISDYNEISANMTLDKDRDVILDATQDCDGDTIPDLEELQGAFDIWTIARGEGVIRQYHSVVGVLIRAGQAGFLTDPQDLIITPDRRILVSSAGTNSVVEFDRLGQFVRTLVATGSGGLSYPTGLIVTPAGELLVCSRNTHSVVRYSAANGLFQGAAVPAGSGGLASPTAIIRSPAGTLLVAGDDNRVREYTAGGVFIRILVDVAGNGGLSSPRGMAINAQGRLLVTSFGTDQVLEYDAATGAFIRSLLVTGLPVDGPWGIRMGPDGFVYVSRHNDFTDTHVTRARIFIFEPRLGNFMRAHTQALDSGLTQPAGFDFMPGDTTDCNRNLRPDSCDIALGYSFDADQNGIPDECDGACYANCDGSTQAPVLNVADFGCFLTRYAAGDPYANCDQSTQPPILNVADFGCYLTKYAAGCP
ncbi:MAG: M12 family metallo-peptidase [Phycisphaerales bacterium]